MIVKIKKIADFFKDKAEKLDLFNLGTSFVLWYILIFAALPIAVYLDNSFIFVGGYKKDDFPFDLRTACYLIAGIVFFISGYCASFLKFFKKNKFFEFFKKEWEYKKSFYVVVVVFFFDVTLKTIKVVYSGYSHISRSDAFLNSQFYSLVGLLDWLGAAVLAIAFINYFRLFKNGDKNYVKWKWLAWILLIFEFLYGLFSLSRFAAIIPILVYLIVRHYLIGRGYLRMAAIIIAIFVLIFPAVSFIRNPGNFYAIKNQDISDVKRVEEFVSDSILRRVGHSSVIIHNVFNKTDRFIHGRSLFNYFISMGPPRFIWKDKPVISGSGNEFGRQMGVLDSKDFTSSVGPTIVGDLYMNFGFFGIMFGMFFVGIIFRFIYDFFIKYPNYSSAGILFYIFAWIQLMKGSEDWIAPVWAGLTKFFVILLAINYFLIKRDGESSIQ